MKNLNLKIKTSPEGTWMFQDYTNSKNLFTYGLLVYDYSKNHLIGYIFVDAKKELEDLTDQINHGKGPNNYVDFCFLVVSNKELLKTAKWIFQYWSKVPPFVHNIGLYLYDESSDKLQELIAAKPNQSDWYLNYIKDVEVDHVKSLYLNQTKNFSNLNEINKDEIDLINYKETPLEFTKKIENKVMVDDSFLPSWAKTSSHKVKNDLPAPQVDFNNEHEQLMDEFDSYQTKLNSTYKLFDDFAKPELTLPSESEIVQENLLDFDSVDNMAETLKSENDTTTDPIVVDDLKTTDYDDNLLSSEYLSKLDEITENLKTNDFSEQTKMILEEFDLNNKEY